MKLMYGRGSPGIYTREGSVIHVASLYFLSALTGHPNQMAQPDTIKSVGARESAGDRCRVTVYYRTSSQHLSAGLGDGQDTGSPRRS